MFSRFFSEGEQDEAFALGHPGATRRGGPRAIGLGGIRRAAPGALLHLHLVRFSGLGVLRAPPEKEVRVLQALVAAGTFAAIVAATVISVRRNGGRWSAWADRLNKD